jgi:hypothetical protein
LKKKILIIGFGNMGKSHLQSFVKKNFTIHIVEKRKIETKLLKQKNIFFFKKIPKNQNYLLTISATRSKERFSLIKKFFETNSTQFLLLEKFCFYSISQFEKFKILYNWQTKTFINSWSYIILNKINIFKTIKKFDLFCEIAEGNLLANISHIFHLYGYINRNKPILKIISNNYEIKKSSKRKNYDELIGSIKIHDTDSNLLKIKTKKNMSDLMNIYINPKKSSISYKISFKNNSKIYYFINKKLIKIIKFPFSSKTSFYFLKNSINKKFNYMPTFLNDYKFSKEFLNILSVKIP